MRPPRLALALAALACSCASSQGMSREAYVRREMAGLVLPRSIDEVWPLAHELLSEQGYNGVDQPGTLEYRSEWREDVAPSRFEGKLTRYHAQGIRLPESRCRVVLTRFVRPKELGRGPPDPSEGTRDFEMELLLYKKVDPDGGAALEREANDPSSRR